MVAGSEHRHFRLQWDPGPECDQEDIKGQSLRASEPETDQFKQGTKLEEGEIEEPGLKRREKRIKGKKAGKIKRPESKAGRARRQDGAGFRRAEQPWHCAAL